jgi:hypothetical protein
MTLKPIIRTSRVIGKNTMELKTAIGVCLISLFSATLVALIARSLDSQAASRLEPQLARIVEELEAIRSSGGIATSPAATAKGRLLRDGLVVYYFHSNTRCPTCQAIESQSHQTVQAGFAEQLESGEIAWEILNYEEPAASELATKFEIQMPVVVLARMKEGQIEDWNRLDEVWGIVGDKPAFAEYIRTEIRQMLNALDQEPTVAKPGFGPAIPLPGGEMGDLPLSTGPVELPIPQ